MNKPLKKMGLAAGLVGLAMVPIIAIADGGNFSLKVGDDNEAHYRFHGRGARHNPEMWKAARSLADAKNHLWYAKSDFGGHRVNAIQDINMALDEIQSAEENNGRDRGRDDRNDRNDQLDHQ